MPCHNTFEELFSGVNLLLIQQAEVWLKAFLHCQHICLFLAWRTQCQVRLTLTLLFYAWFYSQLKASYIPDIYIDFSPRSVNTWVVSRFYQTERAFPHSFQHNICHLLWSAWCYKILLWMKAPLMIFWKLLPSKGCLMCLWENEEWRLFMFITLMRFLLV